MGLESGRRLGAYEIREPLGAGGMGEVYRALDTRLGREVALKLLPEAFASDPDRLARFEREARLLASLSHPHVAGLFALEEAQGDGPGPVRFLAMELAPGEDLATRLKRGPLRVDEAVAVAGQVAEALEAAHEKGIVHRDLKPANVKLAPDGTVKVLDFGLAKAYTGETASGSAPDLSQSPTLAHTGTAAGLILGTAAYMSPEQARGRPADKRADVWAFGVLLWEMLTARQLFPGDTVTDVLASVLTREPDWTQLPAGAQRLAPVLQRCLEKDVRRRFRDIGDVRLELERAAASPGLDAIQAQAARPAGRNFMIAVAVLAAAAVGVLLGRAGSGPAPRAPEPLRLSITLPPEQRLRTEDNSLVTFSPDGTSLVFPAIENGVGVLMRRRLGATTAERIEGTEDGAAPFLSPDGKWLGFIANGKLQRVPAEGGRPMALSDSRGAGGGAWGKDGRIVFAPLYSDGLFRVSAEGGTPERLTTPDRGRGELGHWWPQILPGGKAALFTAFCSPIDNSRVGLVSLETGAVHHVVEGGFFGRYVASGHLLFVRDGRLYAVAFDPASGKVTGDARSVLDDVYAPPTEALSMLDVSLDGTLAWVPGSLADPPGELVFIERDGRVRPALPDARRYRGVSLSPDGRFLATAILGESLDLWTYSLERRTLSRLTSGPRTEFSPYWSPDGRNVFFVLDRPPFEIQRIALGGSAEAAPLWQAELDTQVTGLSPDGRFVVYTLSQLETGNDLWVASLDGKEPPRPFRATRYQEKFGSFSPDGRWITYQSDETGRPEIYAEAFPGPGERYQVSAEGGTEPIWVRGTGEIFYRHGNEMRAVHTRTGARLALEAAGTLFTVPFSVMSNERSYDVTADGRRVVAVRVPDTAAPRRIDIVTHWLDELARRVPR